MKVKTEEIYIHAASIPNISLILPTFQRARLKKVYNRWGICVAKYVIFVAIENTKVHPYVYSRHYIRIK